MRIAWIEAIDRGVVPPAAGTLTIPEMRRHGLEVDVYVPVAGRWRWAKVQGVLSSPAGRALISLQLSVRLLIEHRRDPYHAVLEVGRGQVFLPDRLPRWASRLVEVVGGPPVEVHRATDARRLRASVRSLLEAKNRDGVRARARERVHPVEPVASPSVTICICTRGRPEQLAVALASIAKSTYPVSQVVVSDDLHQEATEAACHNAPVAVDYVRGPQHGLGANRNRAMQASAGDVLLFIDDDCVLLDEFLATALQRMRAAEADYGAGRVIVSGRVLEHGRLVTAGDQTFLGFQSRPYARAEGLRSIVMAATIFPAGLFGEVRFDPRLVYGYDEVDLATRAVARGYTIVDCPQAVIEHHPSEIGRQRNLSYAEASRLHVTLRRYAITERAPLRAVAFAIAAPTHHLAANVKRDGLSGVGTAARTFSLAAAMTWQPR